MPESISASQAQGQPEEPEAWASQRRCSATLLGDALQKLRALMQKTLAVDGQGGGVG